MKIEEMENWIKIAKPKDQLVYYEGHLVEDVSGPGFSPEARKIGLLFLRAAEKHRLTLVQKKMLSGDQTIKPVYKYIAEII